MSSHEPNSFVIAGERSGVGKTTITLALACAQRMRGQDVQCFKVGPDFIDPGHHTAITGRTSRNLDGWMMGRDYCVQQFARHSLDAGAVIVEGVMGLYDGHSTSGDDGSTAQIARWLNLPVIVVVDGSAMAQTAGAVVLGLQAYDPAVHIAGVIFNRVGGGRHFSMLKNAVLAKTGVRVFGYIPRDAAWQIPERHLGLVMAPEHHALHDGIRSLADSLNHTVDLDAIASLRRAPGEGAPEPAPPARPPAQPAARIGVARDQAFCFYYPDNLELLAACGAELVFFSPLNDARLPSGLDALYLGGGYPELHAAQLEHNAAMRGDVLAFCLSGRPVYAECGGFMYLLRSLTDQGGQRRDMCGFFPAHARMRTRLQRLGYVEAEALDTCPFLAGGLKIRGHEFHYSDIGEMPADITRCYTVSRARGSDPFPEGYCAGNVLAGYLHLHFASQPVFAAAFIRAAARKRSRAPS